MRELTESDFEQLRQSPGIRAGLAGIEARRHAATRRFWIVLPIGALLIVGQFYFFYTRDLTMVGVVVALFGAIATWVVAHWGLWRVGEALKDGVMTEAARVAGLRYAPRVPSHPVLDEAQSFLFDSDGTPTVTDLFECALDDGRTVGFFDMGLSHKEGDDDNERTVTDFAGQMFAFSRSPPGAGVVAVSPAKGGFLGNIVSRSVSVDIPGFRASTRVVEIGDDPSFASAFTVQASDADLARSVLTPEIRRMLMEMRGADGICFYCGPQHVLVGIWGADRFEAGSLLRKRPLDERVRTMVDDLNASVATARRLLACCG